MCFFPDEVAAAQPQVVAPQAPVAIVPQAQATASNTVHADVITPAMLEQAVMLLQMQGYAVFPAPNSYTAPLNGYAAPAPSASANYNVAVQNAASSSGSSNSGGSPQAYRNGFHSSSLSNSSVSEAYNGVGSATHPQFAAEEFLRDDGPFWYEAVQPSSAGRSSSGNTSSSFSPPSPDLNQKTQAQQQQYPAAELLEKRRDSYAGHGGPYRAPATALPHPSKTYAPGFCPVPLQTPVGACANGEGEMGMGFGWGSGGLGSTASNPPAFQSNCYQSHTQTQLISLPISGSAHRVGERERDNRGEFHAMPDLNGTLASLGLDRKREREFAIGVRAWDLKSPNITESTSSESRSSGGACSFG
ncbi:hypothetical protein B0H13DRAFT_2523316 [Mycena leptocephala]|nr:hypothetical protein B0H13DRAFT_2523316 [Mycena leptocephala]